MEFELVIQNGTLIDGTGRPRRRADLGLNDGKVAAIATGEHLVGHKTLDAARLVVTPGFIDIHSHSDWILPMEDHAAILAPLLYQGITTVVTGNCGFSPAPVTGQGMPWLDRLSEMLRDRPFPYRWRTFGDFLDQLSTDGLALNAAFLVGHGTLRALVMGNKASAPNPQELEQMRSLTRQALCEGAIGLSAGLAYAPGVFAQNDELLALLQVVAEKGKLFTVHGRAYTWVSPFYSPMFFGEPHNVRSVRELIGLARQAGVRLELSHQIFVGRRTWRTYRSVLQAIERAIEQGQDLAFDAFPYTVGNSTINVVFPGWFLDDFEHKINDPTSLRKLKREINLLQMALGMGYADIRLLVGGVPELTELEGLDFATIAKRLGLPQFEAYVHVARLSGGDARILLGTYSGDGEKEEPLRATLANPLCSFMTDTILSSHPHHNPASFGTFPRILGRYSRDLGLFTLEEAVRRMTSFPAERAGLSSVGQIAEGAWADLVVFDPLTIADHTTSEKADASPGGIRAVMISGQMVVEDQQLIPGVRAGRVLRN